MSLKLIPLGGTTSVNKNMYVYETENDIIVVDCGIGFPDSSDYGVDLIIPDFSYLLKNKHKVRALLVTHAHEDHFGAVPFLLNELKIPVYGTKLVLGFIKNKLSDYGLKDGVDLRPFEEEDTLTINDFRIDPISINHSVPDSVAFFIQGAFGKVLHVSDFKFDWTPVMDKPFDVAKMALFSKDGVDLLLSDCLGSTSEGFTESERVIENTFNSLMDRAEGQVFITTMSSNISRVQQAIKASIKHDRKVVISGRSIDQNIEVAGNLGYLNFKKDVFVSVEKSRDFPQNKLTYIVAGSYGQENSALYRIATDKHKHIELQKGSMVIFSADPNPPGVLEAVNFVIDRLTLAGADVFYSAIQENLHVSGHGCIGDISMLAGIVRPKFFMPIGGTVKFMRAYKNLISEMGFKKEKIFELLDGESLIIDKGNVVRGQKYEVGNIFVDGSGIGDVGSIVLKDRKELAESGMVVIIIPFKKSQGVYGERIQVISRGFVYVREAKKLIEDVEAITRRVVKENSKGLNQQDLRQKIEKDVAKFLFKTTERNPVVLPVIVEV